MAGPRHDLLKLLKCFLVMCLSAVAVAGGRAAAAEGEQEKPEEPVLNVYNWSDYITREALADFEREYGIRINYDTYDASEIVDAKLLAGGTGYDVIVHSTQLISRLVPLGLFLPLDRGKLPNWKNLDPEILQAMLPYDPGNAHAVPYMWGSTGIAYNVDMVAERMPDAPLDSAAFFFDPEILSKFADCGVSFLDSPTDVVPLALSYLGYDGNSQDPDELDEAERLLSGVRPYIKYFSSSRLLIDLPSKEVCVAMSWSGDYAQALDRAEEAGIDIRLAYFVPKEGSPLWIDSLVIPADAPHPGNAHLFLDYLMRPEVIAGISNYVYYANANLASRPYLRPDVRDNPAVYPPPEIRAILFPPAILPPKNERKRTRLWARVKTGL